MTANNNYDVIILGAGHAGTMLATILASNNLNVAVIDRDQHPRFAIGESTIPRTSLMTRIMAARFNTPELNDHAFFKEGCRTSNGIKRHFGFVYHRPGEQPHLHEAIQALIPEASIGSESHLFRQDTDADMLFNAIRRGANVIQKASVTDIEIDSNQVRVTLDGGRQLLASYIVDGTGHSSLLSRKQNLRADSERLRTHTRTLFTHMIGVTPYERTASEKRRQPAMPRPWSQGTLHHVFDGGWLWVIPFDNHDGSANPLCSVGLTLDCRRYPKTDQSPEVEFTEFLGQHPSIREQFEKARKVREWVSTGRLQYESRAATGQRFCLMSHSYGFIDALFSRGLANTSMVVNTLADRLIRAHADGDYSPQRFKSIDRLQRDLIDTNDRLVNGSLISWRHQRLWDAWLRFWILGSFFDSLRLQRLYQRYLTTLDKGVFQAVDEPDFPGGLCPDLPEFDRIFNLACDELDAVGEGSRDPDDAATALMALLRESSLPPPVLELDRKERLHDPVLDQRDLLRLHQWIKHSAPERVRAWYH